MKPLLVAGLFAAVFPSVVLGQNRTDSRSAVENVGSAPVRPAASSRQFGEEAVDPPSLLDLGDPDGEVLEPPRLEDLRPSKPSRSNRPRNLDPMRFQRWDHRFDAQYLSTIKPYLRWYMRYDPARPGERFLSKTYTSGSEGGYAFEGLQGYGQTGYAYDPVAEGYGAWTPNCESGGCGVGSAGGYGSHYGSHDHGSRYDDLYRTGYGFPRSRYWRHLDYLYDRYGHLPIKATRVSSRPYSNQSAAGVSAAQPKTQHQQKTIWVARNGDSDGFSVLFVQPPAAQAAAFYKASALMRNHVKILSIEWDGDLPPWAAEVQVVAGAIRARSNS